MVLEIIPELEGRYSVTASGDIYSHAHKTILSCSIDAGGYRYFKARVNGRLRRFGVTRLIYKIFIGPLLPGEEVDHKDRNRQNDAVENLRAVTRSQNMMNTTKRRGSLSEFKGVCWHKSKNKWQSRIRCNYIWYYLGYYNDENEAALAYDCAAVQLFGTYALTNYI